MKINTLPDLELFYYRARSAIQAGGGCTIIALNSSELDDAATRSTEQNDFYWAFNSCLAKFLNTAGVHYGYHKLPYTKDRVHKINKSIFDIDTTASMSAKDFSAYMDQLQIFWQNFTNGFFNF